ncbi:biotin/lipoate A/B protein ligase family protein [Geitlerinema sp. CS-897]|nr:biotin/lipoate A/B protein ligase family protein [Geitlerinema sp. CS-897]
MGHKPTIWRLIPQLRAPGWVQMGVDEWLLDRHRQGSHPPALRFYTWSRPTISLGYHQRRYPAFWHELQWQGQPVSLVRRPTGGRAVLHSGDLTYAIVTSGMSGTRSQVYRQLCEFLILGWRRLGIPLHFGDRDRGEYARRHSCFATATGADLVTSDGTKLIGSAQLRRGKAVLQHGSMQLSPPRELFDRVFGSVPDSISHSWQRGVEPAEIDAIVAVLTQAARECYNVKFVVRSLSEREWQEIYSKIEVLKSQFSSLEVRNS